jgi:hypothetical protein
MAYKVSVNRKEGNRVELSEVHRDRTPWRNGQIVVELDGDPIRVIVTGVRVAPVKAPKTSIEIVDAVDAREL